MFVSAKPIISRQLVCVDHLVRFTKNLKLILLQRGMTVPMLENESNTRNVSHCLAEYCYFVKTC